VPATLGAARIRNTSPKEIIMNRIARSIIFIALCLATAAAFAGDRGGPSSPNFDSCRIIQGDFAGRLERDSVAGDVRGDVNGRLESDIRTDLDPRRGIVRVNGTGKLSTERGTFATTDEVRLVPSAERDVMIWMGLHKIVGASGEFEGVEGTMISEGLVDLTTGEIKYSFKALICPGD
jgi:hypothetical protein